MNGAAPTPGSPAAVRRRTFAVQDYDLAATLGCGQAFRWQTDAGGRAWTGVVGARWVRLQSTPGGLTAETTSADADWAWLEHYLQTNLDFAAVLASFPDDDPMRAAVNACHGLRLLRQDPWECLASFILSSTKQIVQIRQIIARLAERYGEPLVVPPGSAPACAFPSARRLAQATEAELRDCKMGFRAGYLRETALRVASGAIDLAALAGADTDTARAGLMQLPGVGPKIADCVLLFAYGRLMAFPLDVWMIRALRQLYFPRRRADLRRLREFAARHFGPHGGYAQQYLFHYVRLAAK